MKTISSIHVSNVFRGATFAAFFLFFFTISPVKAAEVRKTPPVEFKYVGNIDYKPVFQIDFNNPDAEEVFLTLRDENGVVIYSDTIKDKKYSKKIQLESSDLDDMKVTLTLRSKKGYGTQEFLINKNIRTVENVEISKL